jgi:hypothetical protein
MRRSVSPTPFAKFGTAVAFKIVPVAHWSLKQKMIQIEVPAAEAFLRKIIVTSGAVLDGNHKATGAPEEPSHP